MEEVQQNSILRTKGNIQVLGFGGSSLQALIRKDGPDPVSRAVQMTKISFPAALNLVSEFMDGSALNLARAYERHLKGKVLEIDSTSRLDWDPYT